MKYSLLMFATIILMLGMIQTSCSPDNDPMTPDVTVPNPKPEQPDDSNENKPEKTEQKIRITIGEQSAIVTLEDNSAAKAFATLLPMTVTMTEMNGNEKYYDLSENLPTDTFCPGTIHAGDLLLWGANTVVLFYETFSSPYSYTRLGKMDNPDGLAAALGSGNVRVTFSLQ